MSESKTPVTIITGFLGAGKSTLLKHVLATRHGLKIAVIQNELSATAGLEASTIRGPNGEEFAEWLELANGCVCCSVRDDFVNAIERLMEVKGRFDYVLIETTGMADPGPVAETFWLDAELESPLQLDGIVTLVDAQHLSRHLGELEACRQIGCADALLLNKCDVVDDAHLDALSAELRQLNALAPIHRTTRSSVDLSAILNLGAFVGSDGQPARPSWARDASRPDGDAPQPPTAAESILTCGTCDEPAEGEAPPPRWLHQDSRFGAVTLVERCAPLRLDALERLFAALFWEPEDWTTLVAGALLTPEVYRAKGVFAIEGSERMHTLQAVHATYELVEGPEWSPSQERLTRLVVIGRNVERHPLRTALLACAGPENAE